MSSNTPYNDNNSILSNVMMTGVLGGGAVASYAAWKHPKEFKEAANKAFDWIAPIKTHETSEFQNRVFKNSAARREREGFAQRRKDATYEAREAKSNALIEQIERSGEIRSLAYDKAKYTEAINEIASTTSSSHHLVDIDKGISLSSITDIHGNPYGDTLIKKFEEQFKGKATNVGFEGTNLSFEINGEQYKLPTAIKDKKSGAWIEKSNGTYRVQQERNNQVLLKDGRLGVDVIGPNEHLASLFDVPESLGVPKGIFDSLNASEINRDMIIGERIHANGNVGAEAKREIAKLQSQIHGQIAITDLTNQRAVKEILQNIRVNAQPVSPTDMGQVQYLGRQSRLNEWSLHDVERSSAGLYEGLGESHLSIGKSMFNFDKSKRQVQVSGKAKMSLFETYANIREDASLFSIGGKGFDELSPEMQKEFLRRQKNIGLTLSQAQSADGTISTVGQMAAFPSVEINKGLGRGYSFTNPVNEMEFLRNTQRGNESSRIIRQGSRTTPLIFSPEVAKESPFVYGNNNSMVNMYSVLDDGEEAIRISNRFKGQMGINKGVSMKVKKIHTGTIDDLPSESQVNYWTGDGKFYQDKTLGQLYEDTELLKRVHRIEVNPGTITGFDDRTGQIDSTASLERVMEGKYTVVKNKLKFTQDRSQILASLQETEKAEGKYLTLFGSQHETAAKIGSAYWKGRSALEFVDDRELENVGGRLNTLVKPEAFVSKAMYKGVIPQLKNGELITGKDRTALFTFLQEGIAGNLGAYGGDVRLDGKLKNQFARLLADPSSFDGSITNLARDMKLQFNQHAVEGKEDFATLVKVLGGMKENLGKDRVINDSFSYEKGAANIEEWLKEKRSFFMFNGFTVHEGQEVQGIGSNIYRVGLKDSPFMLPSEWMGELETRNIAPTTQINTDVKLMLEGNTRNLKSDLDKIGVSVLDKDGLDRMMGNITQASDVSNPYVLADSFLSKDVNPKGFALTAEDGSIHHFGGAATYGGGQWLDEEGKAAVQRSTRLEAEVLLSAQKNAGVLSKDDLTKLYIGRVQNYAAPGGGPLKTGSMHVEGATYGINLGEVNWLNDEATLKRLSSSDEALNLFGSVAVMDRKVYASRVFDDLETARVMAEKERTSAHAILEEQFGKGHFLEDFIKNADLSTSEGTKAVANEVAASMANKGNILKKLSQSGTAEEIAEFIKANGQAMLVDRFPHVAAKSVSSAFGFVADMQEEGKSLALGTMLRLNMNADNDGDKFFAMLGYTKELREVNKKEILGVQKIVAGYMNMFKSKDLLQKAMVVDGDSGFKMPEWNQIDSLIDAMKRTEAESAMTSFVTKGITGSASTRANEIRNVLISDVNSKIKLNGGEWEHAMAFAYSLPGQNIEQKIISGKQTEAVLTTMGKAYHKVESLVNNIGEITKKDFVQGLSSLAGDMGPLHMYSAMIGADMRNGAPGWITEKAKDSIVPQLDTLFDMNFNWRKLEGAEGRKEFDALHDVLQTPKQNIDTLWRQYSEQAEKTVFLRDKEELAGAGWNRFEHIRELFDDARKRGAGSASDSIDLILSNIRKAASGKNMKAEEVNELFRKELGENKSITRDAAMAILGSDAIAAESIAKKTSRSIRYLDNVKQALGPITPMKIGAGIGIGLVAMTAMNLMSGDGTPEDPNDLPSVNNPSFSNQRHGMMGERRMIDSSGSSNMSMGLITGNNERFSDSLQSVSAMYNGGRYNTVSVRSDGADPYSSDMFKYSN